VDSEEKKRLYLPGIDAMRGIVVLIGLCFHANLPVFRSGMFFVDVFGVLSGYLITRMLLAEMHLTGGLNLKRFYLGRFRRLLPALLLTLVAVILYARAFAPETLWDLRMQTVAALLYVYNWYAIFINNDYFTSYATIPIQHLWSLSLEEQFYLIWPILLGGVMLLVRRSAKFLKYVPFLFIGGALLSALSSLLIFHGGDTTGTTDMVRAPMSVAGFEANRLLMVYMSTITRAGGFLIGGAMAFWWRPELARPTSARFNRTLDITAIVLLVAVFLLSNLQWFTSNVQTVVASGGTLLVWVICAVLIMALTKPESRWLHFLVTRKFVVRVGVLSYALYLFHWPIMQFYRKYAFKPLPLWFVAILLPTLYLLAEISQRFIERPIRKMGLTAYLRSMKPAVRRTSVAVSSVLVLAAGVSLITAPRSVDSLAQEVDETIEQTQGVVAGESAEVVVVGDSITSLVADKYAEQGIVVDATIGRTFAEGSGLAAYLVETGQVTDALVMHLGTNEELTKEALRDFLRSTSSLRRVVMVTLWREGWPLLEPNNANIRSMVEEFPNLVVVDWNRVAAEDPETFIMPDGIHIGQRDGVVTYMSLVTDALSADKGGVIPALP
jgi:peptidoglycan/LPS O-acetylase OafA/YrhL